VEEKFAGKLFYWMGLKLMLIKLVDINKEIFRERMKMIGPWMYVIDR
jgi:hypothetical protein